MNHYSISTLRRLSFKLFLVLCITSPAHAAQEANFLDLLVNESTEDPLSGVVFDTVRAATTPSSVVGLLAEVGAIDILRCPLYRRTNPVKTISLLDMPIFFLPRVYC